MPSGRKNETIGGLKCLTVPCSSSGSAPRGVVIWLHGLGDSPRGWVGAAEDVQSSLGGDVEFVLPCAPRNAVTCNFGAKMTSWMDIIEIPIHPESPDNGKDASESLAALESVIDYKMKEHGLGADKIILGGFSQGAALSVAAALKFSQKLCAAFCLSGWALPKQQIYASAATSCNRDTPLLVCHGQDDNVVTFRCGQALRDGLRASGVSKLTFRSYEDLAHGWCAQEKLDLISFLEDALA